MIKDDTESENYKRREAKMSFEEIVYDSPRQIQSYFHKNHDINLEKRRPRYNRHRSRTVDRAKQSVQLNSSIDDKDV
jgi:hypothetical protein